MPEEDMRISKVFFALMVLAGILPILAGLWVVLHSAEQSSGQQAPVAERQPLATGFEFTRYEEGKKLFTVSAHQMYIVDKKIPYLGLCLGPLKVTRLEDIEVVFFEDNLALSRLRSRYGFVDIRRKDFIFEDSPTLFTEDRRFLSAEKISWDDTAKSLRAEGNCILGTQDKRISAEVLATDQFLRDFTIIR